MSEKTISLRNTAAHYTEFGKGKPILILHGWASSSDKWQTVAELLAQKNLRAIVPDLPGFGKNEPLENAWSLDDYVEWLHEFCQETPGLQNSFLIAGHSFGGALAAKFAIKYPQQVEKLFLISAACRRQRTTGKKMLRALAKAGKPLAGVPLVRKAFYKFIVRRSDYPYQQEVMKDTYLKVIADDLSYKLGFLRVPLILIWGDKDTSTPLAEAEFLHQKVLHSQLEVIPGGDHLLHLKSPEAVVEKIMANIAA